ncbi:hypothetical protein [Evansella cellulosilytica]|uniref:Uncharacterized protein n=1 Tax=Evansella cellulosilytica (strain ATCC 21833 / DSM 2522 / FERM P-1141 / JCM 9156 / N-4) TaxID=649639 RepID=E6TTK7_EVAC2|nr:hypothetical protein [Evansella cellulosilytica]ADU29643.1 hypothetical protein Bcell_1378 [Evansella cellulosilytica DSM 2522]
MMTKKAAFMIIWHQFWLDWNEIKAYYYGTLRHARRRDKHEEKLANWTNDGEFDTDVYTEMIKLFRYIKKGIVNVLQKIKGINQR